MLDSQQIIIVMISVCLLMLFILWSIVNNKKSKSANKSYIFQYYPVAVVLFIGLFTSYILYDGIRTIEKTQAREKFIERVEGISEAFEEHLISYEHTLKMLKSTFLASNYIDEDEFDILSTGILLNRPDIKGVHFIPRVVENIELLPLPFWYVNDNQKHAVEFGKREPLIIKRSSSLDYIETLIDMDMGHYNDFKKAMDLSFLKNEVVTSMPVTLFSDINDVFLYYPLFQKSAAEIPSGHYKTIMSRYNADIAFISLSIRINDFFKKHKSYHGVHLSLSLIDDDASKVALYTNSNRGKSVEVWHKDTVSMFSKEWHFDYWPSEEYIVRPVRNEFIILGAGLLLTLFSTVYVGTSIRRKEDDLILNKTLSEERLYLKNILDKMMQGVVTIDEYGAITTFNKWAENIFGYKSDDIISKNVTSLMPNKYKDRHTEGLNTYLETGQENVMGQNLELEGLRKNGESFPMALNITEVKSDKGSMFIGLIRDISGRIKRENELKKAIKVAEEASSAKSDFLANMSHELRTPLNSIIGLSKMNSETLGLPKENREMADIVHRSANNLLVIVNDILDLSKIEAGEIVLEEIGFDFKGMVSNIVDTMAPMASSKGISLEYSYNTKVIPYVIGDPLRVGRILTNLIGNAIKYTDRSSEESPDQNIMTSFQISNIGDDRIEVYCRISDTGIGISTEKLNKIFEKFSQADASTTRKYGGTGLGLTITKDLVDMMDGSIGAESEVGEGSVFWFKLPFVTTDVPEEEKEAVSRKSKKTKYSDNLVKAKDAKVLVAEDHLLNQEFIKRAMIKLGLNDYTLVENGELAVEAFGDGDYDVILMDCHMPEKSGYEATKEIRDTDSAIPIIALTADAMAGSREKCLETGMSDYVSKPIDLDKLKDILSQWIYFEDEGEGEGEDKGEIERRATDRRGQSQEDVKKEPPVIDMSCFVEYTDTPEEMKDLVMLFITQGDEILKILEEHCIDGESKPWTEAAHKQKGASGMIGAGKLCNLCAQGQEMVNVSKKERKDLLAKISKEYKKVKEYLESEVL